MEDNMLAAATVLVIARSNRFRDGLQTLVKALPWVDAVLCQEALTAVSSSFTKPPTLIILDADEFTTLSWPVWQNWRAAERQPHLLVLVSTAQQRHQAAELGADAVLLKGFPTETLYRTMAGLVDPVSRVPAFSRNPDGR